MNAVLQRVDLIGNDLALRWADGREDFFTPEFLRRNSPSAENVGERDLTGKVFLPHRTQQISADIRIVGWQVVGGYALQITFSDGHRTGLYSFDYLRRLGKEPQSK